MDVGTSNAVCGYYITNMFIHNSYMNPKPLCESHRDASPYKYLSILWICFSPVAMVRFPDMFIEPAIIN